jgi:hypothetical protein
MSDLRERVARAICEAELGHDLLDQMVMTRENYFDAADAAIATVFQWQPIETAPKDGTIILLTNHKGVRAAYWGNAQRVYKAQSDKLFPWVVLDETNGTNAIMDGGAHKPTHWLPLPPPPGGGK